jgi:hypothetical protein
MWYNTLILHVACVSFRLGSLVMHDLEFSGINISVVINNLSILKFFIGDGQFRLP